jgi:hypothetical protein
MHGRQCLSTGHLLMMNIKKWTNKVLAKSTDPQERALQKTDTETLQETDTETPQETDTTRNRQ